MVDRIVKVYCLRNTGKPPFHNIRSVLYLQGENFYMNVSCITLLDLGSKYHYRLQRLN